jgi:hypothetical protein
LRLMHELGNGVSTTGNTLSSQLRMNARRTIRLAACHVDSRILEVNRTRRWLQALAGRLRAA